MTRAISIVAELQTIRFEQFNSLIDNPTQLVEVSLCSLRLMERGDHIVNSMTSNSAIEDLLTS
jgi:hypothetical protein